MPSIFIWKATEPTTSKKQLRYYSGSNWFLEENDYSSKSYMFQEQIVLSEFDNSVITYRAKKMPQDWVGHELLEVIQVPYEHIKSDRYGTLERIGNWMRFIQREETEYNEESLACEYNMIKNWMGAPKRESSSPAERQQPQSYHRPHNHRNYTGHYNKNTSRPPPPARATVTRN
jgi:hypothetical protein